MSTAILEEIFAVAAEEARACERKCKGVTRAQTQRIVAAKSLVSGSGDSIGCVMVGLTPLKTKSSRTHNQADPSKDGSRAQLPEYFAKLKDLCVELGLGDTFMWTPLCRCSRIKGEKLPPETMETCARNLLARELEPVQRSVPIVALGNRVFDTIRRCFPDRFVLNVPSPDTSRGDFQKTMDNSRLLDLAKGRVAAAKPGALCLCPPCARKYFDSKAVRR